MITTLFLFDWTNERENNYLKEAMWLEYSKRSVSHYQKSEVDSVQKLGK